MTTGVSSRLRVLDGARDDLSGVRLDNTDLVWVDFVNPQPREVEWLTHTFGLHQLTVEDIVRRRQRPKLDFYPEYCFGVIYSVRGEADPRRVTTSELQFVWGPRYLITLHSAPIPEIDALAQRAREGALLPLVNSENATLQMADLVYRILDSVVDTYFVAIDALTEWVEAVHEQMFSSNNRRGTLQTLVEMRRDVIQLRRMLAPSREVINVLLRHDREMFGAAYDPYFQDVYDHTIRAIDALDALRDLLTSGFDTYLSLASNDVNQTVRKMTGLTTILMVDALIAGIYGMNFQYMPELAWRFGYLWALALMVGVSLLLWRLFKRISWF